MIYYRSAALAGRQISLVQKKLKEGDALSKKQLFPQISFSNEQKPAATFQL